MMPVEVIFRTGLLTDGLGTDNTLSVFASANGSSGPTVSINKSTSLIRSYYR